MDEIARYNQARWKALVEANALFTRPKLDLDRESARTLVDPKGLFGDVEGRDVLCLASGGGQQSAAFALLGARVTVFDLSEEQLRRDAEAADHYGLGIEIVHGDMRDLSSLADKSFDLVFHSYSLNFVTDAAEVFRQVARVSRENALYWVTCANPFIMGMRQEDWNGRGYVLSEPYLNKAQRTYDDQDWVYDRDGRDERHAPIPSPVEYRHTLSEFLNGLINSGFQIRYVSDDMDMEPDPQAEPGSWDHFVSFAPPWLSFLTVFRPEKLKVE